MNRRDNPYSYSNNMTAAGAQFNQGISNLAQIFMGGESPNEAAKRLAERQLLEAQTDSARSTAGLNWQKHGGIEGAAAVVGSLFDVQPDGSVAPNPEKMAEFYANTLRGGNVKEGNDMVLGYTANTNAGDDVTSRAYVGTGNAMGRNRDVFSLAGAERAVARDHANDMEKEKYSQSQANYRNERSIAGQLQRFLMSEANKEAKEKKKKENPKLTLSTEKNVVNGAISLLGKNPKEDTDFVEALRQNPDFRVVLDEVMAQHGGDERATAKLLADRSKEILEYYQPNSFWSLFENPEYRATSKKTPDFAETPKASNNGPKLVKPQTLEGLEIIGAP